MQCLWGGTSWIDAGEGWVADRTPAGPATVKLIHRDGGVEATAWGDGAEHLLDQVPRILGLADDPAAAWTPAHPALAPVHRGTRGVRLGSTGRIFPRLVAAALAQKVTGQNSRRALHGLARAWGEPAPGPRGDLFLLPTPGRLAAVPTYDYRRFEVEEHRAEPVRRIALHAAALARAEALPFAEAHRHLQVLRGIGPWTSGVVVGLALGDPDAVPWGDYNLPSLVAWNLAGEPQADDARMAELLAPYAGQRGRVVRLLKLVGRGPPRRGPRRG